MDVRHRGSVGHFIERLLFVRFDRNATFRVMLVSVGHDALLSIANEKMEKAQRSCARCN
jgi:hypothetical protein